MKTKNNLKQDILRRGIISLVLMIVISFIIYTAFLISTTVSITKTKQSNQLAENLRSEIADIEASYLAQSQIYTLDYAISQGFEVVETPFFAQLKSDERLAMLTSNHE